MLTTPGEILSFDTLEDSVALRKHTSTSEYHFCILIQGLDIWHQVHSWIVDGGRKLPKMTEPENFPWRPTSQWARLKARLHRWREVQNPKMKYPETKVATHAHFRRAEVFAYINLLYYLK